jgi:hypothetical protein
MDDPQVVEAGRLRAKGASIRQVANDLGVPPAIVGRALKPTA